MANTKLQIAIMKINMAFAYPLVFTSYGSVLDGTTKGDYESTCTTLRKC